MGETTRDYLDQKNAIWTGKVALTDTINDVKGRITAIRGEAAIQEAPTEGITDEKEFFRTNLEDLTLEIGSQLEALGDKTGDPDMVAKAHVTRSSLDGAQDDDLVQTAERIHQAATDSSAALVDYDVTAAKITALGDAVVQFATRKTAPKTAKSTKGGAKVAVETQVRSLRSVLRRQLDKQMVPFRKTHPDFYAGYLAARVIVDRPATQKPKPVTPPPPPGP
jgi:hypothetical protein